MTDDDTTHAASSSRLDALETELDRADPADAPAIAEEIAAILSDSLDATEPVISTPAGSDTASLGSEVAGEPQS